MKVRFLILILGALSLSAFADPPIWSTQGGCSTRTGTSQYAGPEQGCIQWTFQTTGPVNSSATIDSSGSLYITSEDGFLYAVNSTGSEIWKFDADAPIFASASIGNDGTIYVGTSAGSFYAVDPNGTEKWSFSAQGDIVSCPAVTSNLILIGSLDGNLYALDTEGDLQWTFQPDHPDSIIASPSVGPNGTIYVGRLYDPSLYALDPADGSILWSRDLSHYVVPDDSDTNLVQTGYQIAPVVHPDGFVLVSPTHDSKLYALDPADGSIEWQVNLYYPPQKPIDSFLSDKSFANAYGYSDICSEPVIAPDGTIYVSMDDMFLRAINPGGSIKWTRRVGMYGGFTMTADTNGMIYAASDDETLYVIEPVDGTIISVMTFYKSLPLPSSPYALKLLDEEWLAFPVLGGEGLLYVSSSDNALYTVQSANCQSNDLHWIENPAQDGQVNLSDLAMLAAQWQQCLESIFPGLQCESDYADYPLIYPYPRPDINRDFYVNMDDLTIIVENWMKEAN